MSTLHIHAVSGLGSRMRAVLGAIAWARNNNADVCVCWPYGDSSEDLGVFPATFHDLWDSPLPERRLDRVVKRAAEWPKYPEYVNGELRCKTNDPASLRIDELDLTGWPYQELWMPSSFVQERVDSVKWPDGKVVGVHIRHAIAQPQTPPVEWFVQRMRELALQYSVTFFLSCDAEVVEDDVKHEFPATICQERTYRYDQDGIGRAAADWILLQRCDWMIGSYHSSYSQVAGWLRGGAYSPGWGCPGFLDGGRYEDSQTPAVGVEEVLGAV